MEFGNACDTWLAFNTVVQFTYTANWDGLEDLQSGVHGYRWWVGSGLGMYDVIPPTNPHMHLIGGQSAWTNSGLVTGLNLAEGSYYITVQVLVYFSAPPTFYRVHYIEFLAPDAREHAHGYIHIAI